MPQLVDGITEEDARNEFNSIMNTMVPLGCAIGAVIAGKIAPKGRRLILILNNVLYLAGIVLASVTLNKYCMLGGRLVTGIACGIFSVVCPLFVTEMAPKPLSGSLGAMCQVQVTFGILVAYLVGLLIPYSDDESFFTTELWRVAYGAPVVFQVLQLIGLFTLFKTDSAQFYLQHKMYNEARKADMYIYEFEENYEKSPINKTRPLGLPEANQSDNSFNYQQFDFSLCNDNDSLQPIQAIEVQDHKEETWGELFCSPQYRYAFFIGCMVMVMQQLAGSNAIIFYSNDIFSGSGTGREAEQSARMGTVMVGVFNLASRGGLGSTLVAVGLLKKFGRKTLIVFGNFSMAVMLGLIAWFSYEKEAGTHDPYNLLIQASVVLYIIFFEFSLGPIGWLYAAEIMTDKGMGIATFTNWTLVTLISLGTPLIMQDTWLKPYGTFTLLAGFCALGFIFTLFLIKETKDRSKIQLQNLYSKQTY